MDPLHSTHYVPSDRDHSGTSPSYGPLIPTTIEERGAASSARHQPVHPYEPAITQHWQNWQQPSQGAHASSYPGNFGNRYFVQHQIEGHQFVRQTADSGQMSVASANPSSSSWGTEAEPEGHSKKCGVCGDVAKSYHFGGLSCDSCKAFFRRSVQNDSYKRFQCYHNGHCVLSINSRKSCQYCRMQRCFAIGMEKSWVMTEEERKALMKSRSQKKLTKQMATVSQSPAKADDYTPNVERMTEHLSLLEIKEIESLVTKYVHAFQQVPYRKELCVNDNDRPGFQIMEMFGTLIRRFAYYARLMPDFTSLPSDDQKILLKEGIFEMCLLRGALVFDPVNNRWPNTKMALYKDAPLLRLDNITQLASSNLFRMHMEFIDHMKQLNVDEVTTMLLVLIVLFTERKGLLRSKWVEQYQAYYVSVLERYLNWRHGPAKSKPMFSKLLTKLSDLRELSETHDQKNVLLGNEEILTIQQQLKHLNINPYPELNIMPVEEQQEPPPVPSGSHHVQAQQAIQPCSGPSHQSNFGAIPRAVFNQADNVPSASSAFQPTCAVPLFETSRNIQQPLPNTHFQEPASKLPSPANIRPCVYQNNAGSNTAPGAGGSHSAAHLRHHAQSSPPDVRFKSTAEMGMYIARAMHLSVSQVVDQPHFGYEWVQPDYRFDGFGDVLDEVADHQQQPSTSTAQSTTDLIGDQNAWKQLPNERVDKPAESRLTTEAMEELYYELERYSELHQ